jgi:hypothetical protein
MRLRQKKSSRARTLPHAKRSRHAGLVRMKKRWTRFAKSPHFGTAATAGAAFLIVLCIGAAALIAGHDSPPADAIATSQVPTAGSSTPHAATAGSGMPHAAAADVRPARAAAHDGAAPYTRPAVAAAPALVLAADHSPSANADESSSAVEPGQNAVTIAGCLERDDRAFELKDTGGAAVPAARSWKSGFLRRRPAAIEILDSGDRLKLPSHVGQRVKVTGQLDGREMHARSLQLVATSCG